MRNISIVCRFLQRNDIAGLSDSEGLISSYETGIILTSGVEVRYTLENLKIQSSLFQQGPPPHTPSYIIGADSLPINALKQLTPKAET